MISVDWKSIIQFGKSRRHFLEKPFKIHFFTYKSESPDGEPGFTSVGLELGFFAFGKTEDEAEIALFDQVDKFSETLTSTAQFIEAFEKTGLEPLWEIYRKLTFLIGDPESRHYEELEKDNAKLQQDNIEKDEEIFSLKIDIDTLNKKFNETKTLS